MRHQQSSIDQPSCIVFDLFHTLVDPEDFRPKDHRRAQIVAQLLGVEPKPFSSYWAETLPSRNTSRSITVVKLVERYLSKIGRTCTREVLDKVDFELGRYQDMAILNPRPEIVSALKTLEGQRFRLGLLTNSDEREVREWSKSPIAPYFEPVCFSCDIGFEKPSMQAYGTVLERLRTTPSRSAYVGDGGDDELRGARAAGFGLIVFMKGFVTRNGLRTQAQILETEKNADTSIDDFGELVRLVNSSSL